MTLNQGVSKGPVTFGWSKTNVSMTGGDPRHVKVLGKCIRVKVFLFSSGVRLFHLGKGLSVNRVRVSI